MRGGGPYFVSGSSRRSRRCTIREVAISSSHCDRAAVPGSACAAIFTAGTNQFLILMLISFCRTCLECNQIFPLQRGLLNLFHSVLLPLTGSLTVKPELEPRVIVHSSTAA